MVWNLLSVLIVKQIGTQIIMKIAFALSYVLFATDACSAFTLQNSQISKRHNLQLNAVSKDNNVSVSSGTVSAREARITGPLSTVFSALTLANVGTVATPTPANALEGMSDFDATVRAFFPGAVPNSVITARAVKRLQDRGYVPDTTILASSLCSDEIDTTSLSLVAQLQSKLVRQQDGGVFNLGGLGGVPFVGKSGFGAFLSHVPTKGRVVILYGPHVGISNEGVVGKVERVGQDKPSGSCGAGIGAYKVIKAGGRGANDKFDFQEEYIIDQLTPRLQGLLKSQANQGAVNGFVSNNKAMATVTVNMFDIVNELLEEQVMAAVNAPGFWDNVDEVTLLGGIVLNRGHGQGTPGGEDYFQPLQFKSLNKNGEIDMWYTVFGDLSREFDGVLLG